MTAIYAANKQLLHGICRIFCMYFSCVSTLLVNADFIYAHMGTFAIDRHICRKYYKNFI